MCLILYALNNHPDYALILTANRDEQFQRPTQFADFWQDHPNVFGGRDLMAGGTWLGITRSGRFAAITNFRQGTPSNTARSRGQLTQDFLCSTKCPTQFAADIATTASEYNGFNLLIGELGLNSNLWCLSHSLQQPLTRQTVPSVALVPGVYGVSNGLPNNNWPKVALGKAALAQALAGNASIDDLFTVLNDRTQAPDHQLPSTGVSLDIERMLSPRFIVNRDYGTRTSTVIRVSHSGHVEFYERNFDNTGRVIDDRAQVFQLA